MHPLLLLDAPEFVRVRLDMPVMLLLLPLNLVVPLLFLFRALNAEVLLTLLLIQLVVVDLNPLGLVFVFVALGDLPDLRLRYGVFLHRYHFLK